MMKQRRKWKKVIWKGKEVGQVSEYIFQTVRTEAHYFRKYEGFGMSRELWQHLWDMWIRLVRLVYVKKNKKVEVYEIPLKQWKDKAILYDNNGDIQYVCPLRYFKKR